MFFSPVSVVASLKQKKFLAEGSVAADFGCGSGYFTAALAQVIGNGTCHAFDIQSEALSATSSLLRRTGGLTHVTLKQADLETLGATGLADGSVDFVLVSNLLYQVDGKESVLREAFRILKPKGFAALIDWFPERMIYKENKSISKESAQTMLEAAGFRIVDEEDLRYHYLIVAQK